MPERMGLCLTFLRCTKFDDRNMTFEPEENERGQAHVFYIARTSVTLVFGSPPPVPITLHKTQGPARLVSH